MTVTPGITVVIPTRGRVTRLRDGLEHIAIAAEHCPEPVEVIVLDDDEDPEVARALADAERRAALRTTYVRGRDYGGHGPLEGRNHGAACASHDVLAFTDDDTVCRPDWLARGLGRLRGDPRVAGVEGAVVAPDQSPSDTVRARVVVNRRGGAYLTANLFVRRDAVLRVGGFQPVWDPAGWVPRLHFREDSDLARRVIADCGPIPFDPEVVVVHPFDAPDLRGHLRTAAFFVLEEAFVRLHPDAVPSLRTAPLARVRVRAATTATALLPFILSRRLRRPGLLGVLMAAGAVSAQVEADLRLAGVRRPLAGMVGDSVRRLPRSLTWALVAGAARIVGMVTVRTGLVRVRPHPSRAAK